MGPGLEERTLPQEKQRTGIIILRYSRWSWKLIVVVKNKEVVVVEL
jgi:hypothetical protein